MSIIGISGRINSGKDTIGSIIQYLYYLKSDIHETNKLSYEAFVKTDRTNNLLISNIVPKIVKFADALKDIVCILTGCTREQLESPEFKNSKLPDEWIRYGYANGFYKYYKNGKEETKMNNVQCDKERYELEYRTNWQTAYKIHSTYRELLQYIGTDLLRDKLHSDVWVNALMSKYKGTTYTDISSDCPRQGVYDVTETDEVIYGSIKTDYPNWIITDVRFPNETKAIKERNGINIRVNRWKPLKDLEEFKEIELLWGDKQTGLCTKVTSYKNGRFYNEKTQVVLEELVIGWRECNNHISETALDAYSFDYEIDNNGTIDELIIKVKEILLKEKII